MANLENERRFLEAVKYLEKSQTALTRSRGRRRLRSVLQKLLKDYPPLDANGEPPAKQKLHPVCPICRIPAKSWSKLVDHLWRIHFVTKAAAAARAGISYDVHSCPCCSVKFDDSKKVVAHLIGLAYHGKLKEHAAMGFSEHVFGDKP